MSETDFTSSQAPSMFLDEIERNLLERDKTVLKYGEEIIELDESGEFREPPKRRPGSYLIDV